MTDQERLRGYHIALAATLGCAAVGVISIIGELICRLNRIETPSSLNTLVGVAIGALAGAVPGSPLNGKPYPPDRVP